MASNWCDIDAVFLLQVFKYMPLAVLFGSTLNMVCRNWTFQRLHALRTRKELVLIGDDGDQYKNIARLQVESNPYGSCLVEHLGHEDGTPLWTRPDIEFKLIRVPNVTRACTLTEQMTNSLMSKFVGITHLTVVLSWFREHTDSANTSLEQLVRIIDQYANSLVSLKLDLMYWGNDVRSGRKLKNRVQALFASINRINTQLNHVSLNVYFNEANLPNGVESLAFLSRVHSFSTDRFVIGQRYQSADLLLASLRQYATGGHCNQIDIGCELKLKKVTQFEPVLAAKMRRIIISDVNVFYPDSRQAIRLFADRFVSLSSVHLKVVHMPVTELARYLSRFPRLIHLYLDYEAPQNLDENENVEQLDITLLPSVRVLTLGLILHESHLDYEKLLLGKVLPSLQVLRINVLIWSCAECKIASHPSSNCAKPISYKEQLVRYEQCAYHTFRSFFRSIPSLRLIQWDPPVGMLAKSLIRTGLLTQEALSRPRDDSLVYIEDCHYNFNLFRDDIKPKI